MYYTVLFLKLSGIFGIAGMMRYIISRTIVKTCWGNEFLYVLCVYKKQFNHIKLFKIVFRSYLSTSWRIQIEETNLNIVNIKKRKYLHNHGFGWYLKNILKRFNVV